MSKVSLEETIRKVLHSELRLIFPPHFFQDSGLIASKQIVVEKIASQNDTLASSKDSDESSLEEKSLDCLMEIDFIQKKADKLETFFDHIISGEVYLKLENVEDEANKITEIKLSLPGMQMFAKEQCKTFEEATDLAVESLRKQIEKYKTKKSIAAEAARKAALATEGDDL